MTLDPGLIIRVRERPLGFDFGAGVFGPDPVYAISIGLLSENEFATQAILSGEKPRGTGFPHESLTKIL
jgi:hypothetical protein